MIRILLLAIIFSFTGLNSHLPAATVEDNLIAGAKKESALVLYLSTNLTDANGLVQLYKSKYPFVKVDMFRADSAFWQTTGVTQGNRSQALLRCGAMGSSGSRL